MRKDNKCNQYNIWILDYVQTTNLLSQSAVVHQNQYSRYGLGYNSKSTCNSAGKTHECV